METGLESGLEEAGKVLEGSEGTKAVYISLRELTGDWERLRVLEGAIRV